MNDPRDIFLQYTNRPVVIVLERKDETATTIDAVHNVFFSKCYIKGNEYIFEVHNGMDNAARATFYLTAPMNAEIQISNHIVTIISELPHATRIMKITLPNTPTEINDALPQAGITEKREKDGKLSQIVLNLPSSGLSKEMLNKSITLLTQIFEKWSRFVLRDLRVENSEPENYQFIEAQIIQLPGNSFIEITCKDAYGSIMQLELPQEIAIDFRKQRISLNNEDGIVYLERAL